MGHFSGGRNRGAVELSEAGDRVESGAQSSTSTGEWVNLRDERGHVQASYNPVLMLLIIKERGKKTMHDLRKVKVSYCEERTIVLG